MEEKTVKKALSSVLAILLTLAMAGMFAACKDKPADPTEPVPTEVLSTTEITTTTWEEPTTEEPASADVNATEASTAEAPATTLPGGATEATTTAPAAADPTTMSKAELLDYFNTAVNAVRTQKPKFDYEIIRKIDKVETTILGGAADSIVNSVVKSLMPGTPETGTVAKGSGNTGKFLSGSESKASLLTVSQISSITATKKGANYEITVKLPAATDPSVNAGNSGYAGLHEIQDAKGVVEAIVGDNGAIKADPAKTTLNYKNGYATIVVNAAGQLQSMDGGFNVDAVGREWSVTILRGDVTAKQSTSVKAFNFAW
jgi:hypothetical protein